jgi:hypothetical protein
MQAGPDNDEGDGMMVEMWASVALLGLWSCVGVICINSRKASRQLNEVVTPVTVVAEKQ